MSFRKWGITILGCAVVFSALAVFKVLEIRAAIAFAESYPEQSATVEEAFIATVEYMPSVNVIGEMVAPQRLDLRNELDGEITAVNFESGSAITKGQVLIQLDTAVEKANLEAAQARANLAKLVYERVENLNKSQAANQDQLDRAEADVTSANAAIAVLKRTIEKKTLRAPFDGRAGLHTFEVGQYLEGNTLIATLIGDQNYMWVDFRVPQFYRQLAVGAEVSVSSISNTTNNSSEIGNIDKAFIVAENTVLDSENRSRSYRAKIVNEAGKYVANTTVEVVVPTSDPQQLLQVPAIAVQNDPLGQYVYLLREDPDIKEGFRAFRQRVRVRTVKDHIAFIEVNEGLVVGNRVAAAGAFKAYEGILVFVKHREPSSGEFNNSQEQGAK